MTPEDRQNIDKLYAQGWIISEYQINDAIRNTLRWQWIAFKYFRNQIFDTIVDDLRKLWKRISRS